jgi:CBS domain-containing protein
MGGKMQAHEVMTRAVVAVRDDRAISDAAQLLVEHGISGMPVVDSEDTVVGIITERDVLLRHELIRFVSDVMTPNVITVEESTPLVDIVDILLAHSIKRVPVLREGRLVGIVSRSDVIRSQLSELMTAAGSS